MKFKITEITQKGATFDVAVAHKLCCREVFNFPIAEFENEKYLAEIKRILKERETKTNLKIDKKLIGKEFDTEIS